LDKMKKVKMGRNDGGGGCNLARKKPKEEKRGCGQKNRVSLQRQVPPIKDGGRKGVCFGTQQKVERGGWETRGTGKVQ